MNVTIGIVLLFSISLCLAACSEAPTPRPATRVSGQMSQAELRAAGAQADAQLLAFADCLDGLDPQVDPVAYPVCLRRHIRRLNMQVAGYTDDLERLAARFEGRLQAIADSGAAAQTDVEVALHYAAYRDVLAELAGDVRAMVAP